MVNKEKKIPSLEALRKLHETEEAKKKKYQNYLDEDNFEESLQTILNPENLKKEFMNFHLCGLISEDGKESYILISATPYGHWHLQAALGLKDDTPGYVKFKYNIVPSRDISIELSYVNKHGDLMKIESNSATYEFYLNEIEKLVNSLLDRDDIIDIQKEYYFDGETINVADTSNSRQPIISSMGSGSFMEMMMRVMN